MKHTRTALLVLTVAAGAGAALVLPDMAVKALAILSFGCVSLMGLSVQMRSMKSGEFAVGESRPVQAMLFSGALLVGVLIGIAMLVNA